VGQRELNDFVGWILWSVLGIGRRRIEEGHRTKLPDAKRRAMAVEKRFEISDEVQSGKPNFWPRKIQKENFVFE